MSESHLWFKLWIHGHLEGPTRRELKPDERSVWIDFLALGAFSSNPGVIQVAPGIPWTDTQLMRLLVISRQLLGRARMRMIETGKITADAQGLLHIVNWAHYQSEYARTKTYRSQGLMRLNATPFAAEEGVANGVAKSVANATTNATPPEERRRRSTPLPSPSPPHPSPVAPPPTAAHGKQQSRPGGMT